MHILLMSIFLNFLSINTVSASGDCNPPRQFNWLDPDDIEVIAKCDTVVDSSVVFESEEHPPLNEIHEAKTCLFKSKSYPQFYFFNGSLGSMSDKDSTFWAKRVAELNYNQKVFAFEDSEKVILKKYIPKSFFGQNKIHRIYELKLNKLQSELLVGYATKKRKRDPFISTYRTRLQCDLVN